MLSEKEQDTLLYPFKRLAGKFTFELGALREALSDWEKARLISASDSTIKDNHELNEKIDRLELGNTELTEFLATLTLQLKEPATDLKEMMTRLGSDILTYTLAFNSAVELYDHRYTLRQKNEINKRITTVNSSRLLSNEDMDALQKQWTAILYMKNDRRLDVSKKAFESRLTDWENLIVKKTRAVQPQQGIN